MAAYTLIVAARPVAGQEAEWNRWYDDVHLGQVLELSGFTSARRMSNVADEGSAPWLALYGIEAADDAAARDALSRLQQAPLTTTPAMDANSITFELYRDGASIQRG